MPVGVTTDQKQKSFDRLNTPSNLFLGKYILLTICYFPKPFKLLLVFLGKQLNYFLGLLEIYQVWVCIFWFPS
jgi:hypothetical protein